MAGLGRQPPRGGPGCYECNDPGHHIKLCPRRAIRLQEETHRNPKMESKRAKNNSIPPGSNDILNENPSTESNSEAKTGTEKASVSKGSSKSHQADLNHYLNCPNPNLTEKTTSAKTQKKNAFIEAISEPLPETQAAGKVKSATQEPAPNVWAPGTCSPKMSENSVENLRGANPLQNGVKIVELTEEIFVSVDYTCQFQEPFLRAIKTRFSGKSSNRMMLAAVGTCIENALVKQHNGIGGSPVIVTSSGLNRNSKLMAISEINFRLERDTKLILAEGGFVKLMVGREDFPGKIVPVQRHPETRFITMVVKLLHFHGGVLERTRDVKRFLDMTGIPRRGEAQPQIRLGRTLGTIFSVAVGDEILKSVDWNMKETRLPTGSRRYDSDFALRSRRLAVIETGDRPFVVELHFPGLQTVKPAPIHTEAPPAGPQERADPQEHPARPPGRYDC